MAPTPELRQLPADSSIIPPSAAVIGNSARPPARSLANIASLLPAVLLRRFTLPWLMAAIAFVLIHAAPGFRDSDFYWHLKAGELIAQTGSVPVSDPFSYTYAGRPWVAHEWLAELIFYWADATGGFDALRLLPASAAAATLLLMHAIVRRLTPNALSATLATAGFFIPLMPFFTLRPQIFTYVCFTLYLLVLLDFKYFRSCRLLWLLPVLMLGWVNLHGAYMIGIGLLIVFGLLEWMNRRAGASRFSGRSHRLDLFWIATGMTFAATLINPQGLRILAYPFELVSMEASRGIIEEWQSPSFHDLLPRLSLAGIFAWIATLAYARRKPDLTELLLPLLLIAAGLGALRHLPLMGIVLLPFFCVRLRHLRPPQALPLTMRSNQAVSTSPGQATTPATVTPTQAGAIHLLVLAMLLAIYQLDLLPVEREGRAMKRVPVGAVDYVVRNDINGHMLNDYDLGGYLIYRLSPGRKVFIDGRADLYGDKFLKAYLTTYTGGEGWQLMLERYGIDYLVLERDAPLRQMLLAQGDFKETYRDERHVVLLKDIPKFRHLIERDAGYP